MKKTFLVLSILVILVYSCKEEDVVNPNDLESTQASQDNSTAENIFNEIGYIIEEGLRNNGQNKSCPSYNLMNSDTSDIDTLIINFGSTDCLHNGKLRRGIINVIYSGKYRETNAVITSTLDNYYVNNNLVQGERIVTNQGINTDGNMWFTIDINNASILTPVATINWESNRVREWVSGQNTYDISDDKYKITGGASGNGINGKDFTTTIIEPLNADLSCLPSCIITSGTAKITPNDYADRITNYGDSLCDCNVDVIINGITYPIIIGH